jgi:hypothetical protein
MKPARYGQRVGKIVCVSLGERQQKNVAASAD